jgi:hypothetical protein
MLDTIAVDVAAANAACEVGKDHTWSVLVQCTSLWY